MNIREMAAETIRIARIHQDNCVMATSAKLCADDADAALVKGNCLRAHALALRSLTYSVSKFSDIYKEREAAPLIRI